MTQKQWTTSVASQWGLFLPPARPSLSELSVLEKILLGQKQKKPDLKVAILGSTPEYRDLCQTYQINYKCLDYNKDNFLTLRNYLLHKDKDDNLLLSDWREMNFEETFDVFMGDLATTVTLVKDHDIIYQNIKKHCNSKALFLLKVVLREDNDIRAHKEIFSKYRKELFYLNPFAAVWREVLLADYDFTEDTMYCPVSLKKLKESFEQSIITEYEFGEYKKRWDALGDFKMNIPLRQNFLGKLSKYFEIQDIASGNDWYKEHAPIIVSSIE